MPGFLDQLFGGQAAPAPTLDGILAMHAGADPQADALRSYAASLPQSNYPEIPGSSPQPAPDPNAGMTHTPGPQPPHLSPTEATVAGIGLAPVILASHGAQGLYDALSSLPALGRQLANEPIMTSDPHGMITDTGGVQGSDTAGVTSAAGYLGGAGFASPKPAGAIGTFGGAGPTLEEMMAKLIGSPHPDWPQAAVDHLQYDHKFFNSPSAGEHGPALAAMTQELLAGGPAKAAEMHAAGTAYDPSYVADIASMYKPTPAIPAATPIKKGPFAPPKKTMSQLEGDELAALQAKIAAMPTAPPPPDLLQHVQPLDWSSYTPPRGAYQLPAPSPTLDRAAALGYNTNVPLFKGMSKDMDADAFWDPSMKPNERAIFAADDPEISQGYAGLHNLAPMYARADKPFAVNWPDVAPHDGYNGTIMQMLIDHVRAQGGDALVMHNIRDLGGPQTQYAFMDPTKLRVRHAAFSPDAVGSANLLSTQAPPVVPLPSDDRRERR